MSNRKFEWGLCVFIAVLFPRPAGAETSLRLAPCHVPQVAREVSCGTWEVFENREAKTGRKLRLNVVVLPATGSERAPDPVVYFSGGPGEGATREAALIERDWAEIGVHRDFLLVDVRGTGDSNALPCAWGDRIRDLEATLAGLIPVDLVQHCRPQLEERADLSLYTTSLAVDDVDEVRQALGYARVNVIGASYGTRAAQDYARRHSQAVRSLVLWDVVPMGFRMPVTFARDAQDAFDKLADACAAEAPCRTAFPDPRGDLKKVVARLDAKSADVTISTSAGPARVRLTRGEFSQALRYMLYSPRTAALVPLQVHLAAEGDFRPIAATAFGPGSDLVSGVSKGDYLSVTCAEDVPFFTDEEAMAAAKGTFTGDFRWRAQKAACRNWPSRPVAAAFLEPIHSDVPTFLIGGTLDPVNPPRNVEEVAKPLIHSRKLLVERGGHDFEGMENSHCIDHVIASFVSAGDEQRVDTACVAAIRPAPFVLR